MARGAEAKATILTKLQNVFPEGFMAGKDFRVPVMENGEEVQVKITLTAAKDNIEHDGSAVIEKAVTEVVTPAPSADVDLPWGEAKEAPTEPSDEEKDNITRMMSRLF